MCLFEGPHIIDYTEPAHTRGVSRVCYGRVVTQPLPPCTSAVAGSGDAATDTAHYPRHTDAVSLQGHHSVGSQARASHPTSPYVCCQC